ncbi:hypothetical protein C8F01DRAFT_1183473 [Mycena amicta]|nr:hypothetical protein C8F01DRAFT_1183473 [Mycena amicta]
MQTIHFPPLLVRTTRCTAPHQPCLCFPPRHASMLSFRRSFPASPEALSPGHPYSLDNSKKSCQVPFVEFRGNGPPSSNFGHPGDVYVDSTPSSYALYWRDRNGREPGPWRRWTALLLDQVPLYKYLVSHPWADDAQRSDLYLWVDPTGVSWTSRAEICASRVLMIQKNIATISPGERNPDVAALIAEILVKMIDAEDRRTLPPILERSQTSPTPYTSPSVTGRGRSQSSASHYSSPAALPQRDPRPSSPQSQYPSKRRNTITNPPQHERSTTRLSPLGATISPRLPPTAHPSRAKSPPHTHAPSSFRPSPYERPAPSPSPHPISPRITPSFSDHRPQPEHYRRETTYPAEYPATSSRRHESDDDDRNSPPSPGPPSNGRPPANEHENFAWTEMQRAQYAEAHFKRELRQKNRELAKCASHHPFAQLY